MKDRDLSFQRQPEILVIDDVAENLQLLTGMLSAKGYKVRPVLGGRQALALAVANPPDLILLDITMPEMDGYEVCAQLKASQSLKEIPVIFISGRSGMEDKIRAFDDGGVDFVTKPFDVKEVQARVETHLKLRFLQMELEFLNTNLNEKVLEKTQEITESQLATLLALATLAEYRDDETGKHLERVRKNCGLLTMWLGKNSSYKDQISLQFYTNLLCTAPLHDIGKVGIPDAILLKPGKLTAAEFEIVKKHTVIGADTLETVRRTYPNNGFISMGAEIARHHHEKWDGSGYPDGLSGQEIPLEARIMAVADVYDALRTKRVYKPAFSQKESCRIMFEGSGKHFDPEIIEAFRHLKEDFDEFQADQFECASNQYDVHQRSD